MMEQSSRRRLLAAAFGTLGVSGLPAACGALRATPSEPALAQEVKVSFAAGSWGTRAGRKEVTEAMLKEFGARYPLIKVDLQTEAPSPEPNQTWITRVVSGDIPDIMISSGALFEWMAKRQVWADITPALQRLGWRQSDVFFNPATVSYQGKQHAVPFVAHQGGALVYNKTLFAQAGVPEPAKDWTWDDVLGAAKKLTAPDKNQWGIDGNFGHGVFFASVWANNGEVLSRDFKQTLYAGTEGVEAMELLSGFILRHRVSPTPQQRSAERLAFNAGNYAMVIDTPGRQTEQGIGGKFEWDITYFPKWLKTKRRVAIADYSEWAVTSAAHKRAVVEQATRLAAFYTNDFTQGLIADISPSGTTPANMRVARSPRYLAPPPRSMHAIVDMLDSKEGTTARGWPYFEHYQPWQLPIRTMTPKILSGEINVKDGLRQAAEQADREVAAVRG